MYKYNAMLVDSLRSAISKEPKYRERLRKIYLPLITFGANMCFRYRAYLVMSFTE